MAVSQAARRSADVSRAAECAAAVDAWHPKRGLPWAKIGLHAVLIFCAVVVLFPLLWVVLAVAEVAAGRLPALDLAARTSSSHSCPTTSGCWQERGVVRTNFINSVMVTVGTVICATVAAVLAGYALVHLKTPARKVILAAAGGVALLPDPRDRLDRHLPHPASTRPDQRDVVADPAVHGPKRGDLDLHHARHFRDGAEGDRGLGAGRRRQFLPGAGRHHACR